MKPFRRRALGALTAAALLSSQNVSAAVTLDISSVDSIKDAAKTVAQGMMQYYSGNLTGNTPGLLPGPYYWWEAGAMFGAMVDYWYFTGDTSYNDVTTQALLFQAGPNNDYMPPNQTKDEGNDDQAFWGMAALSAAENRFPNPPSDQPQWLALAQAVFNSQALRWDTTTCAGGLKWQIFTWNNGYNYKNTISNGCFFNMAARLAVYTGNNTYSDWAEKMWDWCGHVGLRSPNYFFYDGTDDNLNCTQLDHNLWTYNAGTFLIGAANMYNYTGGSQIWEDRLNGIIAQLGVFFKNGAMYEACEATNNCDVDQKSFKAYLARWMAATTVRAPFTYNTLMPMLQTSAQYAINTCTAGADGNQCGLQWTIGANDGSFGVGEQMSVLEITQSLLSPTVPGPVTANTGGTSKGNPSAGTGGTTVTGLPTGPVTTADKAGAGILTILVVSMVVGGLWWMIN